jgi:hypothetical protein
MTLAWMGWLGCTARLPPATSGIELEDPNEAAQVSAMTTSCGFAPRIAATIASAISRRNGSASP